MNTFFIVFPPAIRFISGGDCGTDLHAVNNNTQAAKQDPMIVVIGGDLA